MQYQPSLGATTRRSSSISAMIFPDTSIKMGVTGADGNPVRSVELVTPEPLKSEELFDLCGLLWSRGMHSHEPVVNGLLTHA